MVKVDQQPIRKYGFGVGPMPAELVERYNQGLKIDNFMEKLAQQFKNQVEVAILEDKDYLIPPLEKRPGYKELTTWLRKIDIGAITIEQIIDITQVVSGTVFEYDVFKPLMLRERKRQPNNILIPPEETKQLFSLMFQKPIMENTYGQKGFAGEIYHPDYLALSRGTNGKLQIVEWYDASLNPTNDRHLTDPQVSLYGDKRKFADFYHSSANVTLVVPSNASVAHVGSVPSTILAKDIITNIKSVPIHYGYVCEQTRQLLSNVRIGKRFIPTLLVEEADRRVLHISDRYNTRRNNSNSKRK